MICIVCEFFCYVKINLKIVDGLKYKGKFGFGLMDYYSLVIQIEIILVL